MSDIELVGGPFHGQQFDAPPRYAYAVGVPQGDKLMIYFRTARASVFSFDHAMRNSKRRHRIA